MTAGHDDPPPVPTPPARRSIGVAPRTHEHPRVHRVPVDLRYPAMFHVAGGRLVWDGTSLRLVGPGGTRAHVAPPAGRVLVTVADTLVVHLHPARAGAHAPSASAPTTTRVVVLDRSADRFARFADALRTAHPGTVTIDDRTVPSARTPRLRTDTRGSRRRPGVFARALWHVRTATGRDGEARAELVDALERLAALHRDGALTTAEYTLAKARLLG